jgi:type I restriction enzyme S subunit
MSAVAMKDSGVKWLGEIPAHWKVAEYINGAIFKPSDWADAGVPIIRIQNLTGASDKYNYFAGDKPDQYRVLRGDMLISWSASIGVFVWHGEEAWLNQHIFKVDRLADSLSKDFFLFSLRHSVNAIRAQTHGSTMKHIVRSDFLRTKMTLPPLHEQRAIASYLDRETARIDSLIAKTEALNALLREKRVALISAAVTGKISVDLTCSGPEKLDT